MINGAVQRYRHILINGVTETEPFKSPQQRGSSPNVPQRNRASHGAALQQQVNDLRPRVDEVRQAQLAAGMEDDLGIRLEFESFPDIELAFESLARERSGIELLNVRYDDNVTLATVFVPYGKLDHFEKLIGDYLQEKHDSIGRPRDNQRLVDAIQQVREATLLALWTDEERFPTPEGQLWWEVWLRLRKDWQAVVSSFRERAEIGGMRVLRGEVIFPERAVLLVNASVEQMTSSMAILNEISELRRPKETAEFFDSLPTDEQREWLDNLLSRTRFPPEASDVPHVCIFDTGVSRGHALLNPALAADDTHSVEPGWGTDDGHGHGTEMAGLALVGNLADALSLSETVSINHRLESVKLLPQPGATGDDPHHHGYLTQEAAARTEVNAPYRRRVFGMAVTAPDNRDRGQPSAWSATLDSLTADSLSNGNNPRLVIVSAGNASDIGSHYPSSNETDGIHDPAQAWNVLTVGACTNLVHISEADAPGYTAIAPSGGLSPFSTTSSIWSQRWPLKPDVLFEGGNTAMDQEGTVWNMPSLSLLTTHHRPADRLFTTTCATSAATALASRMAAQIMTDYRELWPETVRALIVHSAEWTDAMRRSSLSTNPTKAEYLNLLRRCGFGVPDLSRALWSVANSLTMVLEERLQPFTREVGSSPRNRDMQVHSLPWPQDVLEDLGATEVEMRVTLSYFIEPNPSRRGRSRYRYESHGLRFDVKRPHETLDEFRVRINAAARDEEATQPSAGDGDPHWLIGKQARHRGSLHSDIWKGSAADLAARGCVGVYPSMGWWRTRPQLEQYDRLARYSLVVSIRAPETNVDLYTEVANRIGVPVVV